MAEDSTDLPPGYKAIPEEDQRKARVFFDRAKTVADTGNYEYAIEMYLQGLNLDPESVETHTTVREMGLIRKTRGGKPLGMFKKPPLKKGDDKHNMLAHEQMLAYDPGSMEHMKSFMLAAQKAGCYDTVLWIGGILLNANLQQKQPSFQTYITLKDTFKAVNRYKEALDVMSFALRMKPSDMDLNHEAKNLAAQMTIQGGGYASGGSFRESIRDMDTQKKWLEADMDIRSTDNLERGVRDAQKEYEQEPADVSRFNRYVDALRKTENMEYENRAIELLDQKFRETKQYRFKGSVNQITIAQLGRQERSFREEIAKHPDDPQLKKDYQGFLRDRTEREYEIFRETVANYPTDSSARFEMGKRLFVLRRFEEAIGVFQQARNDPKFKAQASTLLGRAFLEAGFVDEAVDTLQQAIADYPVRGDEKSIDIHYYCALSLEKKGDVPAAIKMYSQVAQWNFTFRDVQQRIKRLRGGGQVPPPATPQQMQPATKGDDVGAAT